MPNLRLCISCYTYIYILLLICFVRMDLAWKAKPEIWHERQSLRFSMKYKAWDLAWNTKPEIWHEIQSLIFSMKDKAWDLAWKTKPEISGFVFHAKSQALYFMLNLRLCLSCQISGFAFHGKSQALSFMLNLRLCLSCKIWHERQSLRFGMKDKAWDLAWNTKPVYMYHLHMLRHMSYVYI
jgi:hypothetical protein